ncbi:MAG: ABC transporter permease [Phycisphaerales bacterium]
MTSERESAPANAAASAVAAALPLRRGGPWTTLLHGSTRVLALAAVFALFALLVPEWRFLHLRNIENILVQSTVVATAAIGATLVILAGGLDLSVGSTLALSVVVVATTLRRLADGGSVAPMDALLAAGAGVVAGGCVGAVNGTLVAGLRVGPFIVTLGTMQMVRGLAKGVAGSSSVYAPETWLNGLLESVRGHERGWMLIPPGVWLMVALAIVAAALVRYTVLGRHLVAVGSSEETARLCGVRVRGVTLAVYVLAGLFAGVAGVLQYSYIGLGDPTTAVGLELYAIAAVVIGGGSLRGGEGSVFGTIAGALIIGVLEAGGVQMGWPTWLQEVMAGAIIVGAVAVDRWRR